MIDYKNRNNEAERRSTEREIDDILRISARGRDVITASSRLHSRRMDPAIDSNEMLELMTLIER